MATYVNSVNNLSNLPNLGILNLVVNHITKIDLTGCLNLNQLNLNNNQLTSLDISNCSNLSQIAVQNNPEITTIDLPNLYFCIFFTASGGSLKSEVVDNILISLANQGITGGYCFLDGNLNGIPSDSGINAANYLTGDAGWVVTYNT